MARLAPEPRSPGPEAEGMRLQAAPRLWGPVFTGTCVCTWLRFCHVQLCKPQQHGPAGIPHTAALSDFPGGLLVMAVRTALDLEPMPL